MGRVYNLQAWRRVRTLHLTNEPLCRMCTAMGRTTPATQVDHITPISKGGAWFDGDNLQSLCQSCHSAKTSGDKGNAVRLGTNIEGQPIDASHPWNAG